MFGLSELAVILVVVVVVLGIKRLPELTRSAGKAVRIFKSEAKAFKGQDAAGSVPGSGPGTVGGAGARAGDRVVSSAGDQVVSDAGGRVVFGKVVDRDDAAPRT
ncbi:twin-arginine translocase TatA/TatE family subunit [Streptomyces sp. NPDC020800]|uniref:twin-arginine translocase TatA/TatE family subunit n=1 Tax=Streptomyces sp. NPDC020800 TaxID=3365092 RepID=UPI0037AD9D5D